jgi:Domain of unknown function (DUF4350)
VKQKLFIFSGLAVLIVVLVGLNAVSYTQKEAEPDSETRPNRSTYNAGATGTRAFFDLLNETGRKSLRWQETPDELLKGGVNQPSTFVIIGRTRREIGEEDAKQILQWVSRGGKLVIIDRNPPEFLVKTTANWNIIFNTVNKQPVFNVDSSDQKQMTANVKAAKPIQPTIYTTGINGVQASMLATSIGFEHLSDEEVENKEKAKFGFPTPFPTFSKAKDQKYNAPPKAFPTGNNNSTANENGGNSDSSNAPIVVVKKATPPIKSTSANSSNEKSETSAPVIHLSTEDRNVLVDAPYGDGQIVFLSDPYIVANGGINLVDNAQLAINIVTSRGGIIAFDEYHQGYGTNSNQFLQFFAGTPVVPIFLQGLLLIGLIFFSQSRRFARAVPEPEPNRLSKLEYVSAMAELQQRTKGYDLAIENIYTDFRRRVSRLVGVDAQKTRRQDLAMLIVERLPDENAAKLEELMQKCEDVMHGDKTNKKEVLRLTTRLRELEAKLGLQRRKKSKK